MSQASRSQSGGKSSTVLPLQGVRFVCLGSSRAGRRLSELLTQQGAVQANPAPDGAAVAPAPGIDIVIDDQVMLPDDRPHAERWMAVNAQVVHLRFTDFPRSHPRWNGSSRLIDEMIHAELGLNRVGGGAPEPEPLSIASAYGAFWGAVYIAAALQQRARSGRGSAIELPLFSAAQTVLGRKLMTFADATLVDTVSLPMLPLAEIYACADGRYVQNHGSFGPFARALCKAFGRDEWSDDAAAALASLPGWGAVAEWRARFAENFKRRPAMAWEDAVIAAGGACTACRTREEWIATHHAREAKILGSGTGSNASPIIAASCLSTFDSGAQPGCPAATAENAVFGGTDGRNRAPPLAGVRVVDFCVILAGPTCGRTLGELGADVIKIDAPRRTMNNPYGWLDVNRCKRSILIDLRTDAGREIALRAMAGADIVLENLREGKMAKLGLGYEDARKVRSSIVYASLNAFDFGGPWSDRPGWEHNAQAATGMQIARAKDGVPKQVPVPVNDYATGLLGAYGVVLALRHAQQTGQSVCVTGSLSRTASFIQTEELAAAMAGQRPGTASGTGVLKCADGWVRVAAVSAADLKALSTQVEKLSCAAAMDTLRSRGVFTVLERTIADLEGDKWLEEAGLRIAWSHPHWGAMAQVSAAASASDVEKRAGWPAPDLGENTETILGDLGYSATEISKLLAAEVVRSRVPLFPRGIP